MTMINKIALTIGRASCTAALISKAIKAIKERREPKFEKVIDVVYWEHDDLFEQRYIEALNQAYDSLLRQIGITDIDIINEVKKEIGVPQR